MTQPSRVIPLRPKQDKWIQWLKANVDTNWRPEEWRQEVWLFTGKAESPMSVVAACSVARCRTLVKGGLCVQCRRAFQTSELPIDEFVGSYEPRKHRVFNKYQGECCIVEVGGTRCHRVSYYRGLCSYHRRAWSEAKNDAPGLTLAAWVDGPGLRLPPAGAEPRCHVLGCERGVTGKKVLCHLHQGRYRQAGVSVSEVEFARCQTPYLATNQFSLGPLSELLRWELLYAMQARDRRGGRLDPVPVRQIVRRFLDGGVSTIVDHERVGALSTQASSLNLKAHLIEFARTVRDAHDEVMSVDLSAGTTWDLVSMGLMQDPAVHGGNRRNRSNVDFGVITQPWLRELTRVWAKEQTDPRLIRDAVRFIGYASAALNDRHDGGNDPRSLGGLDADAVVEAYRSRRNKSGALLGAKHRRRELSTFFEVIGYARSHDLAHELPGSFRLERSHVIASDEIRDEEVGKAIPDYVCAQLDASIDLIGRNFVYGSYSEEIRHEMFRAAYIILRDTGRRPSEVCTLSVDCVKNSDGEATLLWDNHKAGRMGRGLPIVQSTVKAIERWATLRRTITVPSVSDSFLFPAKRARGKHPHMGTQALSSAVRFWADSLPRLDSNIPDGEGNPLPFDRSAIFPYAFRHTYAQRHADAGVPVDVLRDLMDHKDINTTTGYYVVTAERKRTAVEKLAPLAIDRSGRSAPIGSDATYQAKSVAVPFGNCIEPSNVKAGGQACPTRFQCAGCGFYRPDPSFLPAIEEQINALKTDRETAMAFESAEFVITNLTAQIDAYTEILQTLQRGVELVDDAEREAINEASRIMRRARAGRDRPLLPLTVVQTNRERP